MGLSDIIVVGGFSLAGGCLGYGIWWIIQARANRAARKAAEAEAAAQEAALAAAPPAAPLAEASITGPHVIAEAPPAQPLEPAPLESVPADAAEALPPEDPATDQGEDSLAEPAEDPLPDPEDNLAEAEPLSLEEPITEPDPAPEPVEATPEMSEDPAPLAPAPASEIPDGEIIERLTSIEETLRNLADAQATLLESSPEPTEPGELLGQLRGDLDAQTERLSRIETMLTENSAGLASAGASMGGDEVNTLLEAMENMEANAITQISEQILPHIALLGQDMARLKDAIPAESGGDEALEGLSDTVTALSSKLESWMETQNARQQEAEAMPEPTLEPERQEPASLDPVADEAEAKVEEEEAEPQATSENADDEETIEPPSEAEETQAHAPEDLPEETADAQEADASEQEPAASQGDDAQESAGEPPAESAEHEESTAEDSEDAASSEEKRGISYIPANAQEGALSQAEG